MRLNKLNYIYNMIKLTKITSFCIVFLLIMSCKTNKYSFLNKYPVKTLPHTDSTSFSNHLEGELLNKKQQQKLSLDSLFGEQLNQKKTKVGVSYLPQISKEFTSVVYYLYINNSELTCVLVNYDKDFNVINDQMVAYDEISDGVLKSTAMIYNDKIILKEHVSEITSIINFDILENGDIKRE